MRSRWLFEILLIRRQALPYSPLLGIGVDAILKVAGVVAEVVARVVAVSLMR